MFPRASLGRRPNGRCRGDPRCLPSCRLFYIIGHGVDEAFQTRLESLSRQFFLEPLRKKLGIRMEPGGHAWRGYFPVRGELTSRKPDLKEGLYFGAGLPDYHPRVAAGTPLHGRNLFPDLPGFRAAVLDYMSVMTRLGCGTPSEHTWSRR